MSASTRFKQIDALKGLGIFMVILAHSIILFPVDLHEVFICKKLFTFLSSIHMPLFFILAGFVFSYRGDYKSHVLKKASALMVPYVIFGLVDMVPRMLLPQLVNGTQSIGASLKSMALYGGGYWFLYTLFFIFLIYPFLWMTIKDRGWAVKAAVTGALLVLAFFTIPTDFLRLKDLSYYLFYFHLGVMVKDALPDLLQRKHLPLWIPVVLLAAWVALIFSPWRKYLGIPMALMGIVVCYSLTRFSWFNTLFAPFGKVSLPLYLLNGFLLVISRTIICRFTHNPALIIGFNMLVDFGISYLMIRYVAMRIPFCCWCLGMKKQKPAKTREPQAN